MGDQRVETEARLNKQSERRISRASPYLSFQVLKCRQGRATREGTKEERWENTVNAVLYLY